MMRYVGIENSPIKAKMVQMASKIGRKIEIELPCITAKDCDRHFELLTMFDDEAISNIRDIKGSLYYEFNRVQLQRKRNYIWDRVKRFRRLYQSIKKRGYLYKYGYIVLSEDGARLDGSHRGAIVEHLGLDKITVIMVNWRSCFKKRQLRDLYRHLNQQRKKYG